MPRLNVDTGRLRVKVEHEQIDQFDWSPTCLSISISPTNSQTLHSTVQHSGHRPSKSFVQLPDHFNRRAISAPADQHSTILNTLPQSSLFRSVYSNTAPHPLPVVDLSLCSPVQPIKHLDTIQSSDHLSMSWSETIHESIIPQSKRDSLSRSILGETVPFFRIIDRNELSRPPHLRSSSMDSFISHRKPPPRIHVPSNASPASDHVTHGDLFVEAVPKDIQLSGDHLSRQSSYTKPEEETKVQDDIMSPRSINLSFSSPHSDANLHESDSDVEIEPISPAFDTSQIQSINQSINRNHADSEISRRTGSWSEHHNPLQDHLEGSMSISRSVDQQLSLGLRIRPAKPSHSHGPTLDIPINLNSPRSSPTSQISNQPTATKHKRPKSAAFAPSTVKVVVSAGTPHAKSTSPTNARSPANSRQSLSINSSIPSPSSSSRSHSSNTFLFNMLKSKPVSPSISKQTSQDGMTPILECLTYSFARCPVLRAGWLHRRLEGRGSWTKLLFVLIDYEHLVYFESSEDVNAAGAITLHDTKITESENNQSNQSEHRHCILLDNVQLHLGNKKRSRISSGGSASPITRARVELSCDSYDEFNDWIFLLTRVQQWKHDQTVQQSTDDSVIEAH